MRYLAACDLARAQPPDQAVNDAALVMMVAMLRGEEELTTASFIDDFPPLSTH